MKPVRLRILILLSALFLQTEVSLASVQGDLPKIDSHRFETKPISKSTSGKVYLFESNEVMPKTGNLILIYENDNPVMAFRVLKNENHQFVAKRVRRYDDIGELTFKKNYNTIEKLGDLIPPPPTESIALPEPTTEATAPQAVQQTVESKQSEDDLSDLDQQDEQPSNNPANPEISNDVANELDENVDSDTIKALDEIEEEHPEDEEAPLIELEETNSMDPFKNILSIGTGYFANSSNFSLSPFLSNGFSISYAHSFVKNAFFETSTVQDSFSLELGGIHYVILNKDGNNDQYTLYPFYGNLLYQLNVSRSFSFNAYGGITYNFMATAVNPGASFKSLQGFQPNFGIGAFYMIGPQWFFRADIGWDRITGGLSVKW